MAAECYTAPSAQASREFLRISIIIRCLNEEEHIGRLLTGILQQTVRDVQIILVDSGSTDATLPIASRYPVEIVSITPEEFSFGRSLNRGCAAATGDVLVIASAHVYPLRRDWLELLVAPLEDPRVALAYGKQRGREDSSFSEQRIFAAWFPETSVAYQPSPFCNNANAAIRRDAWIAQPYDELLTGLEDIDWARRAREAGREISYVAEAEVVHVHAETAAGIYNRYRREALAFSRIFPHEQFGLADFLRLFTSNVLSDSYQATRSGAFAQHAGDILRFRLMQFWGTYRGFARRGPVSSLVRQRLYYPRRRGGSEAPEVDDGRYVDYSAVAR